MSPCQTCRKLVRGKLFLGSSSSSRCILIGAEHPFLTGASNLIYTCSRALNRFLHFCRTSKDDWSKGLGCNRSQQVSRCLFAHFAVQLAGLLAEANSVQRSAIPSRRGIGAEFVRQLLLDKNNYVFATMRSVPTDVSAPIKNLQARYLNEEDDRLSLVKLDTTDEASVKAAVAEVAKVKPDGIDYLINNAGGLVLIIWARLLCLDHPLAYWFICAFRW